MWTAEVVLIHSRTIQCVPLTVARSTPECIGPTHVVKSSVESRVSVPPILADLPSWHVMNWTENLVRNVKGVRCSCSIRDRGERYANRSRTGCVGIKQRVQTSNTPNCVRIVAESSLRDAAVVGPRVVDVWPNIASSARAEKDRYAHTLVNLRRGGAVAASVSGREVGVVSRLKERPHEVVHVPLFDVGENSNWPADSLGRPLDRKPAVGIVVRVHRDPDLLHVVGTLHPSRSFAHLLHGGEK